MPLTSTILEGLVLFRLNRWPKPMLDMDAAGRLEVNHDIVLLFNVTHAYDPSDTLCPGSSGCSRCWRPAGEISVDQWAESGRSTVGRAWLRFITRTYLVIPGGETSDFDTAATRLNER